jgi:hypothetical protein
MKHLEEEDLILYHYRDGEGLTEAEGHLAACGECRARLKELEGDLELVKAPETPTRGENYGAQVWDGIRAHLPQKETKARWWAWPRLVTAGAFAALLVGAFLLGRFYQGASGPTTNTAVTSTAATQQQVRERVLLVAVGDHLDRSQMLLVELSHAEGKGEVDISNEQRTALDLADSNRLYRTTALEAGDTTMAAALDDLERVLMEIGHEPPKISEARLKELQERIQAQGVLFKVRVIRGNVQQETAPTSEKTNGTKGQTI